jgi:hypothetical protein
MNPAADQRFRELAIKLVGRECTAEEKAELRSIIDQNPERREELKRLCTNTGIARELLPLSSALEATEGRMSVAEMESFKKALARRREEKGAQESTSRAGDDSNRSKRGGRDKVIDVDAEDVASDDAPPRSRRRRRARLRWLVNFVIGASVAWLLTWLLQHGCSYGFRWKFAIVQPVLNRSEAQIAPLRSYLERRFSNVTVETMENGGRQMRDWESSKTGSMVQVKCILEGVRLHPSWLVDRIEVKGWRKDGVEFQKTFRVANGNWRDALEEVRRFVRDY